MDKRKLALIGGGIACAVIITLMAFLLLRGDSGDTGRRNNTLRLAAEYIEKGEFQRALDLIDQLLLVNPDDEEARTLRDEALEGLRLSELRRPDGSALTSEDIARLLEEFRNMRPSGGGSLSLADIERILAARDREMGREVFDGSAMTEAIVSAIDRLEDSRAA